MTSSPAPTAARPLRLALLAVIAVGLVGLGGGLAVALGIGRGEPTPSADSVDVGFSRDMARHHLQGVEMANLALERSQDADVRMLAFDISSTQSNQVGRMQGWLVLWGHSFTGGEVMAWMGDSEHAGHDMSGQDMSGQDMSGATDDSGLMPGMATEEELASLRELSGEAFDVEFLRLMIRHHQGGKDMAVHAVKNAGQAAVRDLARSIADSQTAETTLMAGMLADRGGTPLPAP
jgi:uncharacterized protein (DUF305 family)